MARISPPRLHFHYNQRTISADKERTRIGLLARPSTMEPFYLRPDQCLNQPLSPGLRNTTGRHLWSLAIVGQMKHSHQHHFHGPFAFLVFPSTKAVRGCLRARKGKQPVGIIRNKREHRREKPDGAERRSTNYQEVFLHVRVHHTQILSEPTPYLVYQGKRRFKTWQDVPSRKISTSNKTSVNRKTSVVQPHDPLAFPSDQNQTPYLLFLHGSPP